ncbi:histidinol-phosphate transaminase [Sediminivirga luteola]|uniref:Histidinol-phosphate aminotransferase n=1 Tax=Sediminivirga luteola TaxID=1774748 RepID=A0A8J2TXI5_9MICO|nr:histidinol-phosphate aminotransferase [Sediminivirga luteola]
MGVNRSPATVSLDDLPLRDDLRGKTPYGAPQLDVPVQLNVNENAHPVPREVTEAIAARLEAELPGLNRYPDREFTELRQKLAAYLSSAAPGVPELRPEQIWAANGSNEVLAHLLQAFGGPGRIALGFGPSYSMHPLIASGTGARFVESPREPGYAITADLAAAAIDRHDPDVVFLCTPNNPTGTLTGLDVIEEVYDRARGIVIVDEAYAEFSRDPSQTALRLLPGRPRLVVSRTMSKAFAFAGARLGYLAADPAVCDALRLVRLPYHLSALTQAAACAALDHAPALLAKVEELKAQRERMATALRELGLTVHSSDSNFLLFGGLDDPQAVWQQLLDRGVLIRNTGIDGHLRVNAGTEPETTAFLNAITEVMTR